jgi:type I restriction system adenine methylase HsdM
MGKKPAAPKNNKSLEQILWDTADKLRGGMDISLLKDYVLTLLFVKYVSAKYAGNPNGLILVPEGGSFVDIVKLKGDPEIGDKINRIIGRLAKANDLQGVMDIADFNRSGILGTGREMVDRLSCLVAIFEGMELTANEVEGEGLVGDIYEYVLKKFADEQGKFGGEFYPPVEISHIMAEVLDISEEQTTLDTTIYDPTCGSGSLLLQVAKEANYNVALYGQEMNSTISAHATMNMIVHNVETAVIATDNVLASPKFLENNELKKFDYVVGCPPSGLRNWSQDLEPEHDSFNRFTFGIPPKQQGDFAFIQHMLASLKPEGKMAVLISHGALFRGNAEAGIRQALVEADLIEAIIGLPSNLMAHTSIPMCILVCNMCKPKERANKVLIVNADRDFSKDGRKNVLLPEHVSRITDTFKAYSEIDQFSRLVSLDEIRNNDFNLNISRYVDTSELAGLLKQYCDKFEKYQLKDLALETNSVGKGKRFEEKPNAIFIPRYRAAQPIADIGALPESQHDYFQVVLNKKAVNHYVAQFLRSSIGKLALSSISNSSTMQTITRLSLNEVTVALPSPDHQRANIETHRKLSALRESIEKINQDLSLNPTSSSEFEAQLDSMLETVGNLSKADQVRSIMRQGESKTAEFKETFSLCLRENEKRKYVETSALKTIVAFLNSEGGTLLIGVSDTLQIVGIERELNEIYKKSEDKFLLNLKNSLKERIGEQYYPFINYELIEVDGLKLIHFQIARSDSPCWLDKAEFYVRTNPASDKIEGQKQYEYLQNHFKKHS